MRKAILAGNWKMYKTNAEAAQFMQDAAVLTASEDLEFVICAPFTTLGALTELAAHTPIKIGAQNMHHSEQGAFTGEISPIMLKHLGVQYVIVGHSERRTYFHEDNAFIAAKVKAAFQHSLIPILCVGETLMQYEANETEVVVREQTETALQGLSSEQVKQLVVAYEPVWAIGTGKTASAQDANHVIGYIRQIIAGQFDSTVADQVRILYGGSVKPENIAQFMAESDIDGALVGGASLAFESFKELAKAIEG